MYTNEERERVAKKKQTTHVPVTVEELLGFIDLLIFRGRGNDQKCVLQELFYGAFSRPFYRATMTNRRFRPPLTMLRLDEEVTREERRKKDEMAAIREVFEHLNALLPQTSSRWTKLSDPSVAGAALSPTCQTSLLSTASGSVTWLTHGQGTYMLRMLPHAGRAEVPDPERHVAGV